jgi:dTMP kinase
MLVSGFGVEGWSADVTDSMAVSSSRKPIRLAALIGIDGSGKSSLAQNLATQLRDEGVNAQYVHALHRRILIKLVKKTARLLFTRGTSEYGDYERYRKVKTSAGRRHPFLSRVYAGVWFVDYTVQMLFRVTLRLLTGKVVIADRYIYDQALNISLATGWSQQAVYRLIDLFSLVTPKPDAVILVDTPEEVCWARKDDVPSIEYLRERRGAYLAMAERYSFHVLDGRRDPDSLVDEALELCFRPGKTRTAAAS